MNPQKESPGGSGRGDKASAVGAKDIANQANGPAPVKRQAPKIVTDPEFKAFFRPLTDVEKRELEASIQAEGCRESLIVWERDGHEDVLLDGHNRFDICNRLGIPFNVESKNFPDRRSVLLWMIRNQVGRRQLTPTEMDLFMGKLYESMKKEQGGDRKSDEVKSKPQNEVLIPDEPTSSKVAREFGVSKATVERAAELVRAVETVKQDDPDIEAKIVAGQVKPSAVKKLAKAKKTTIKKKTPPKVKLDPLPMIVERAMSIVERITYAEAELKRRLVSPPARTERLRKDIDWCADRLKWYLEQIRNHKDTALADIQEHDEQAEEFGREFSVSPVQVKLEAYYGATIERLGEHVPDIVQRVYHLRNPYRTVFAAIMDIERAREIIDDDIDWTRFREVKP